MKTFQVDGKWWAFIEGGWRNDDRIEPEYLGPFDARPEPITKWQTQEHNSAGTGTSVFTIFKAGQEQFVIETYSWDPAPGYSWGESWESRSGLTPEPPELGESFRWTGDGWEPCPHPMRVE